MACRPGVCTNRLDYITRFVDELEVGTVNIWEVPGYRIEMSPFGGIKDSGLGYKEGVVEAMKGFTNVRTYSLPWAGVTRLRTDARVARRKRNRGLIRSQGEEAEHAAEVRLRRRLVAAGAGSGPALAAVGRGDDLQRRRPARRIAQLVSDPVRRLHQGDRHQGPVCRGAARPWWSTGWRKEKSNPQADVLVTLPPFIQKAAADGLLQAYTPGRRRPDRRAPTRTRRAGSYAMVNNYANFIYDASALQRSRRPDYEDLLDPKFKNKIQYSTPGQAGDGTAVMLQVFHAFGSKEAGFAYLKKLQANNLGPSSSTGKLTALVNKGELWVANGDIQMNTSQMEENPNIRVFWPAGPDGKRSDVRAALLHRPGHGAPHPDAGKKLIDFLLSKQAQSSVSRHRAGPAGARGRAAHRTRTTEAARHDEGREDLVAGLDTGAAGAPAGRGRAGTRRPAADGTRCRARSRRAPARTDRHLRPDPAASGGIGYRGGDGRL